MLEEIFDPECFGLALSLLEYMDETRVRKTEEDPKTEIVVRPFPQRRVLLRGSGFTVNRCGCTLHCSPFLTPGFRYYAYVISLSLRHNRYCTNVYAEL